jgi:hypothetical protein
VITRADAGFGSMASGTAWPAVVSFNTPSRTFSLNVKVNEGGDPVISAPAPGDELSSLAWPNAGPAASKEAHSANDARVPDARLPADAPRPGTVGLLIAFDSSAGVLDQAYLKNRFCACIIPSE